MPPGLKGVAEMAGNPLNSAAMRLEEMRYRQDSHRDQAGSHRIVVSSRLGNSAL